MKAEVTVKAIVSSLHLIQIHFKFSDVLRTQVEVDLCSWNSASKISEVEKGL